MDSDNGKEKWSSIICYYLISRFQFNNLRYDNIDFSDNDKESCVILDHKFWGRIRISYSVAEKVLRIETIHIAKVPQARMEDFRQYLANSGNTFIILDQVGILHTSLSFHCNYGDILWDEFFREKYTQFEEKMERLYPTSFSSDTLSYPLADSHPCRCGSAQTAVWLDNDPWPGEETFNLYLNYCHHCGGYQLLYMENREYAYPREIWYFIPVSGPGEALCLKEMYGMSGLMEHILEYETETIDY